ncbi:DUF1801 domain-containing protein [Metabacillus malikii]|uniref:YdhG-like domain-containing protein n=1 Tax=Metabacillus malikii TaxID=1504265 RepID=A0ABT9ZIG8_9BACI|nr:DUF1801 domain-containing protein [Metabacillus malikii]MDQ0232074.1 hypothetical protein [Metabacillus malikii]
MNPTVTEYLDALDTPWKRDLCNHLREAVHKAIPNVEERIQYKKPHFLKNGKYDAVISVLKINVSFTIYNTQDLQLPEDSFSGPQERKTLKLKKGEATDFEQLSKWVKLATRSL